MSNFIMFSQCVGILGETSRNLSVLGYLSTSSCKRDSFCNELTISNYQNGRYQSGWITDRPQLTSPPPYFAHVNFWIQPLDQLVGWCFLSDLEICGLRWAQISLEALWLHIYRLRILRPRGSLSLPKQMNFRKSSKRPLTPPPHFRKIIVADFL